MNLDENDVFWRPSPRFVPRALGPGRPVILSVSIRVHPWLISTFERPRQKRRGSEIDSVFVRGSKPPLRERHRQKSGHVEMNVSNGTSNADSSSVGN
jgi:hypothetical protein